METTARTRDQRSLSALGVLLALTVAGLGGCSRPRPPVLPERTDVAPTTQPAEGEAPPEHVRFVADPEIGRAECVVETPEGIVESTLDAHLSEIGEALKAPE